MKTWLLTLVCTAVALSAGADWREDLGSAQAGAFPLLRPLRAHYKFGWTAFTAAEADFDFARTKGGLMRLGVNAKTTGMVRSLWRMDAQHFALMQPATLRPVSVRQAETYDDQTRRTKLDFGADGVTRLRETTPPGENPAKPKRFEFPNLFDLHSALQFVRSQRLATGDVFRLVVYPTTDPFLAQVSVGARGKVKAGRKPYNAIPLDLKLWKIDGDLGLVPYDKFKRATVWLSDDANRLLLKLEGEIFVGTVWAELESVEFR